MSHEKGRMPVSLAIVGEYRPQFAPHLLVEETLEQAARTLEYPLKYDWIATSRLAESAADILREYDGIWISPGSPYASAEGALRAITFARQSFVPLLGTCGGFQHVVLEFGRNVLGVVGAQHEEENPDAEELIVTALSCSPAGTVMPVVLDPGSQVAEWYGRTVVREHYFCHYGLSPTYEQPVHVAGLRIVGRDEDEAPRVLALHGHPFFVAALYVPEPSAEYPAHPLVREFVQAAAQAAGVSHPAV